MPVVDTLATALADVTFRQAVLLLPIASGLHVLEEWPRFPRWARRFASPRYSDREYVITHVGTVLVALTTAALLALFPLPWVVFGSFALVLGPAVLCNALFHAAASLRWRAYCPGVLTGLVVYLPLFVLIAGLAMREGPMSGAALLGAVSLAAVLHALEVGHSVFQALVVHREVAARHAFHR